MHCSLVFVNMLCYRDTGMDRPHTNMWMKNDITVLKPEIKTNFSQMQNEPFHIGTAPTKSCILLETETHTIIFDRTYTECYGYQIFYHM